MRVMGRRRGSPEKVGRTGFLKKTPQRERGMTAADAEAEGEGPIAGDGALTRSHMSHGGRSRLSGFPLMKCNTGHL